MGRFNKRTATFREATLDESKPGNDKGLFT